MSSPSDLPAHLPADLRETAAATDAASERLLATVTAMPDDSWREPSVLPGWSRAHVVAHLTLNAEGMAAALGGLADDRPAPIYASNESRDADIDALAAEDPETIRERLREAVAAFAAAARRVPAEAWSGTVERVPGTSLPAADTLSMRQREVEIHHADIGAGYTHADWPSSFVVGLLDTVTVDQAGSGPFRVTASDLGRSWDVAEGPAADDAAEVTGTGGALGWWLVGRGTGEELDAGGAALPELGPWRRAPRR